MCFPQQGSQKAPAVASRWLEGQAPQCQGFLDSLTGVQVSRTIATCLGGNASLQPRSGMPTCIWKGCLFQTQYNYLSKDRHFPIVTSPAQLLASLQPCGSESTGQCEIYPLEFVFPLLIPFCYYFCPISKANRTAVPYLLES